MTSTPPGNESPAPRPPAADVSPAAHTPGGNPVTIEPSAIKKLEEKLHGSLLRPADQPGFKEASLPSNGRYRDTVPALVAQVANEADVVACVTWAKELGIHAVPRGGGHNYAALSTTTGLIVDLSQLNTVAIDKKAGTMTTGGAASNRSIYQASKDGDFILPGGTCLGVGVGGLVLGGGIGYHTRWAGLTSDHLTETRMVTADGDIVVANHKENKDLFWASQGGTGGTFGINTQFKFTLARVPTGNIVYYRFDWRGADAALAMFTELDKLAQTAPPKFVASARAQATPLGTGEGPRDAILVMVRGQFLGSLDDFMDLVRPLLKCPALAKGKKQIIEQSFWETAVNFTAEAEPNHSYGDISRYTKTALKTETLNNLVNLIAKAPYRDEKNNAALFMLDWVGGEVVNNCGRTDTAYVHRDMTNMWRPTPEWDNTAPSEVGKALMAWTDDMISAMKDDSVNESYQNFPNRSINDWREQYFAENLDRLVVIKKKYDPTNFFRSKQSLLGEQSLPVT